VVLDANSDEWRVGFVVVEKVQKVGSHVGRQCMGS
jgi:tetrahydromethanopterin S-methyltransferase subunit G